MPHAATQATRFQVQPLAGAVGALITGIDLRQPLDAAAIAEIRAVWLDSSVVFFRDQHLPPAELQVFAEHFGQVVEYTFVKGIEGFPLIIPVLKLPHERNNFGGIWHTDTAYLDEPPMATMLIVREVPPFGGDTLFASGYAAFDALSPAMQHMLEGLRGVNTSAKADTTKRAKTASRTPPAMACTTMRQNTRWCARIRKPGANRYM